MKVALVHDYLREYGGAERVVETLHDMFPDAPVYVAFYDQDALGAQADRFKNWDIRETALIRLPFYKKLFSPYRIFAAWAFEQLDLTEFDVIISSTNMYMAKAVKKRSDAIHLSYIHTPPRSLYGLSTRTQWKKRPLIRVLGELLNIGMRAIDRRSSKNPDVLIANSRTTKERIEKYYGRDSTVVYPPVALVDKKLEVLPASERDYVLFVGRQVFSKHPELAVSSCRELDLPLKVVGTGPMLDELMQLAGDKTEFLGSVSDSKLAELYSHAKLVVFPAEDEDFGIVPIEAMAAGTPVVAHNSGEPRYTITPGLSGLHVDTLALADWQKTINAAWKHKWNYQDIQQSAQEFSQSSFIKSIQKLID